MIYFKNSLTLFQKVILVGVIIFGLLIIALSFYAIIIYDSTTSENIIILDLIVIGIILTLLFHALLYLFKRNIRIRELQSNLKIVERDKAYSDQKYNFLFLNNRQVMWIFDIESLKFLDVNAAAISTYGYTKKEFLSMNLTQIRPVEDIPSLLINVRKPTIDFSNSGIWKHYKKNGELIYVEIITHDIIFNGCSARHSLMRDVTKVKAAELALTDIEVKYHSFFESSMDAIFITLSNGETISVNKAACDMFGYSVTELIALGRSGIEDKSDKRLSILLSECYRNGKASGEVSFIRKNGIPFTAEISSSIFKSSEGILQSSIIVRDITKRKDIENELVQSEEKYRTIFENVQDVFYKIDLEGIVVEISPSIQYFDDFKPVEIIGFPVSDLYENPEDRVAFLDYIHKNGEVRNYELKFKTKTGKPRIASVNARLVLNAVGKPIHIVGSLRDITDLKLAEKEITMLAQSLKSINECLSITDSNDKILFVNESFLKTYGYEQDELIGQQISIVGSSKNQKNVTEGILKTTIEGEWKGELINKRKDGSEFPIFLSTSKILDRHNQPIGLIGVASDITERKHAEEELIKSKNKAEESDRLKSAFLANMSHEIRTPMNGIIGFSELLKEPLLTGEEQHEYIEIIQQSGSRMLNIINDIVSISKVESGQMEVSIKETNINEQLNYIYTFFKPEAEQKRIELRQKNLLPLKCGNLLTDKEKLYAVLINLVKNALKFTDTGIIEFGCKLNNSNEFEFFVSDTGVGIDAHQHEFIFDRFRQGSESLNRNYEGAGLGLAISKAYVLMMGGKIWVESTKGKGSTFYFTLPYIDSSPGKEKTAGARLTSDFAGMKLKILIAEDDDVSGLYINKILKSVSDKIIRAKTGAEAIELCKINPAIDLILMDIKMPVMDGYEATREIRKFNPDVVIFAQTSFALTGDSDKALAAGCNDYIAKPYNKADLYLLIEKHFKN